jgi:quinol monooxygenase YgiN
MRNRSNVKVAAAARLTGARTAPEKGSEAPMKAVYVKYEVDPSFAETNAENIRKVMSDLRGSGSDGVRYQSFRQSDGVTFVHFGMYRDQAALDSFTSTPSFQAFQTALKSSKPVQPPAAEWLDIVDASYEIF